MIIGCLASFVIFGGLGYLLSKIGLSSGYDKDNKMLALLFYFLAPLIVVSIVSCIAVGVYSMLGFSMSAVFEGIAHSANVQSSGLFVIVGTLLTAIFAITAIAAGPASAFTAAWVSSIGAAAVIYGYGDEEFSKKWLPIVAFAVYGFCLWPFTAILTFGL